jgi:HAD superfamily hydrolase (TIGR01490 family)
MAAWAVFDIDGTLLPAISMEQEFLKYLFSRHLLPPGNVIFYFYRWLAAALTVGWEAAIKTNKSYLRGLRVDDVEQYAEACFDRRISPAIGDTGKQQVEQLRGDGYKILIISGAPSFLVRRLEPVFRPDSVICTELETEDECYTGRILGLHPFGDRKRLILESIRDDLEIDFSRSVVFANHHSDIDHMRMFAKAVAVNPTAKLRKFASKAGWTTAIW